MIKNIFIFIIFVLFITTANSKSSSDQTQHTVYSQSIQFDYTKQKVFILPEERFVFNLEYDILVCLPMHDRDPQSSGCRDNKGKNAWQYLKDVELIKGYRIIKTNIVVSPSARYSSDVDRALVIILERN